jgi:transposase
MTKARRSFTDEFNRETVALLASSGRPLMFRNWRKAVGVPAGASSRPATQAMPPEAGHPGDQPVEIARPLRDVERLRMERDILKNELGSTARLWRKKRVTLSWTGGERPKGFWWT